MSCKMGLINENLKQRIFANLKKAKLPSTFRNAHAESALGQEEHNRRLSTLTASKFCELMAMEKMLADGQLSLILLKGDLGNSIITNDFTQDQLSKVVAEWRKE